MSDDLLKAARSSYAPPHYVDGESVRPLLHVLADLIEAQAAEITRLRVDRNAEISARIKAEGEFSTMQRRIARQRRALAKLYQRRHDKNAALFTAWREGMEEAAKIAESCAADWAKSAKGKYINSKWDFQSRAEAGEEIAAAILAAAKEDRQP